MRPRPHVGQKKIDLKIEVANRWARPFPADWMRPARTQKHVHCNTSGFASSAENRWPPQANLTVYYRFVRFESGIEDEAT
jgi:hypothetical protein